MAPGDVSAVETGDCTDLYYVDTGMYDVPEYGSVYVVDADRPAVVDTGIGTHYDRILAPLDAVGIDREDLATIAVTHVHLDHAGGAGYLAAECPGATVAVHERGARHLVDPGRLWAGTKQAVGDQIEFYAEPRPVPADRIRELTDGDRIDLGDRALRVHLAPGHAPHQVAFEDRADDCVFTADAAGIYVPAVDAVEPTTPPPQFDLERAVEDARAIAEMDPSTLCYAHFGPAPTGDRPEEYVETLRSWVETVREARATVAEEGEASGDGDGDDAGDDGDDDHQSEAAAIADRIYDPDSRVADVWGQRKARDELALNVRGVLAYLDRD